MQAARKYIPKPNSGSLFPNDKRQNDRAPQYTGSIDLDREAVEKLLDALKQYPTAKLFLSAWVKDGQKGRWLSLAANPGDRKKAENSSGRTVSRGSAPADDDIPF